MHSSSLDDASVITPFSWLFLLLWVSFAVSKDDLQATNTETEVGDIFWNTRIVPILHELEKGKEKKASSFCFNKMYLWLFIIYMSPITLKLLVHFDCHFCEHVQKQMKSSTYLPRNVYIKYYM